MPDQHLSAKDEALLILEYLESERLSETFLKFLDESKHLHQLRAHLHANYEHPQSHQWSEENPRSINEFQTFFNFSKQMLVQQTDQSTTHSSDLFFDDDFLNDIISQTPPMDDLPETPIPSILNQDNEDLKSIEQLFATQHPSTTLDIPSTTTFTKCIVVTQDFLQSFYSQSSTMTSNNNINNIHRPKRRRRRRLKLGKENSCQQRKIMPRLA